MNIQIIDISKVSNLNYYIKKYNAELSELLSCLFAMEIRNISELNYNSFKNILNNNRIKHFVNIGNDNLFHILILSELRKFKKCLKSNSKKDSGMLSQVIGVLDNYLLFDSKQIVIKEKIFDYSSTNIMGIINVTPDSFSDGGEYYSHDSAVSRAVDMIDSGVDIIDIGGESTRPGADSVSLINELERVIPVIKEVNELRQNAIISVDTTKADVAAKAIEAGASIINDISAYTFDSEIIDVAQSYQVPYCLMHIKGNPKTMQVNPSYDDPVAEIYDFLNEKINYLKDKGVENIIIDPGIGFGKRISDNFEIISRLSEFKGLGFPILIGISRKSFIGNVLNLKVENRDIATVIAETYAVNNGATFIRTHNTNNALKLKTLNNYFSNLTYADND